MLSTISVLSSLLQTRKNLEQLHDMARHSSLVTVVRDGLGNVGEGLGDVGEGLGDVGEGLGDVGEGLGDVGEG